MGLGVCLSLWVVEFVGGALEVDDRSSAWESGRHLRSGDDSRCETASWCEAWQFMFYGALMSAMFWAVAKAMYEDIGVSRHFSALRSDSKAVRAQVVAVLSRRINQYDQNAKDFAALVEIESKGSLRGTKNILIKWIKLDKEYYDQVRRRMFIHLTTDHCDDDGPSLTMDVPLPIPFGGLKAKPYPSRICAHVYNALKRENFKHHPELSYLKVYHWPSYPHSAMLASERSAPEGVMKPNQRTLISIVGFGFLSMLVFTNIRFCFIYDGKPLEAGPKAFLFFMSQIIMAVSVCMISINESSNDFILHQSVQIFQEGEVESEASDSSGSSRSSTNTNTTTGDTSRNMPLLR